jgi:BlaI family transcriptional regulator, penicillinase repressor
MKRLTRKEEDAMKILWAAGKGFVKDLIDLHPNPKPHYNTFSTMIRGLEEQGFIGHHAYGKNHEYYPLVTKEAYRKSLMKNTVTDYFESSYRDVVSFFVEDNKLSSSDLKDIIKLIEKGKKNG